MKTICILFATALLSGCATSSSVVKLEGKGVKRTFPAACEKVWPSAVNACRHGELSIEKIEPERGFIGAKTGVRLNSYGELVAVWVRKVDATNTEVEVVSRLVGPRGFWKYDWTDQILNDIAIDLGQPLQSKQPTMKPTSPKEK